ncbi:MAG: hypothetical protein V3V06_06730 [Dehalococcoidia bacterium]
MPPPPLMSEEAREPKRLSRLELAAGIALFSGLVVVLGLAAAVLVKPDLVYDFGRVWPLLAAVGFASTVGGFWWLWWRPR